MYHSLAYTVTSSDRGSDMSSTVLGTPSVSNLISLNPGRGLLERRNPGMPGGGIRTYTDNFVTSIMSGRTYDDS